MKKLILVSLVIFSGCGNINRMSSGLTGKPYEYCFKGVTYLQFPSGATVALDVSGKPFACN